MLKIAQISSQYATKPIRASHSIALSEERLLKCNMKTMIAQIAARNGAKVDGSGCNAERMKPLGSSASLHQRLRRSFLLLHRQIPSECFRGVLIDLFWV